MKIEQVCQTLADIAPLRLAEEWDNVGLLMGDRRAAARRIMTCLTVTPDVVAEAVDEQVDLLVSHHPLPFRPMGKITADSPAGSMLWTLARSGVAVYSAHTAYDSAATGINQQWLDGLAKLGLKMTGTRPMNPLPDDPEVGSGRVGDLIEPISAGDFLKIAARFSGATRPRLVGRSDRLVKRIAVGCGSGGSFVSLANRLGCDLLLTGEATFHNALEAENTGLSLTLVGHYASERFAMEHLAEVLARELLDRMSQGISDDRGHSDSGSSGVVDDGPCWVRPSRREHDVIAVDPVSLNP